MKRFHHHPDNKIIVENNSYLYIDSIENFQIDSGESYMGLPEQYKERLYIQSKLHVLTDQTNEAFPQSLDFSFGDQLIERVEELLFQQTVRLTPVVDVDREEEGGEE